VNPKVRSSLLAPVLAVVAAVLLCSIALIISGANPAKALGAMIGQVGESTSAVDILNSTAIYMIAAIAAAIGFHMNLLNIGIEGQYRMGAVVAVLVGGAITLPPVLHWIVILLLAMLAGAAWATLPAFLKVTRGVHEVLSTIMMNSIALGLAAYLINPDVFGTLVGNTKATEKLPESAWVSGLDLGDRGEILGLVVLAAAVAVGYWFMMGRTRFGFELRASGESPTAALAGGIGSTRMTVIAMLMSGAVAGLIAMPEILGREHVFTQNFTQGYGFAGIGIALIGRNHPVGIVFGSLLWAFLEKSKLALDDVGVPREMATIMQGTIVIAVVIAYEVVKRMDRAAEQRRVGRALGTAESEPEPAEPVSADAEAGGEK
jgi:general nucleoside transport system permease protein